MYSIMLVDDDSIVRVRLKNMLQWEQLDCRIVAEASNGMEAIAKMEREHPDILITDIDMPGMNGVDLIQYVQEVWPETYILALSAYDDFEYVRDSMKYGAQDYVLKHQLTPRKLEAVLQEAFVQIPGASKRTSVRMREEKKISVLGRILEAEDEKDDPDAGEAVKFLKEKARGFWFLLAAGKFWDDIGKMAEKKKNYAQSIVGETLSFYEWEAVYEVYQDRIVILFLAEDESFREDIIGALNQVSQNVERYTGIQISFTASPFFRDVSRMREICQSLIDGRKGILIGTEQENSMRINIAETQELEQMLRKEDAEGIRGCLNRLFERLGSSVGTSVQISVVAVELCNVLQRKILGMKADHSETSNGMSEENTRRIMEQISKVLVKTRKETDIDTVRGRIVSLYDLFISSVGEESKYQNPLMNESICYIRKHLTEPISLRDVADALNVNSAYLSRLFKKYTGKTIVTFINELKMEKAKDMISEGEYSLKEISIMLGFQNYNYFYRLFKEVYGAPPSDL